MHFVEPGAHLISFPHRGEPMGTVGEKKGVLNLLRLISSRGCTISNWPDSDIFLSRFIVYWKTYKYMAPNDFIYFLKNLFILCNHLAKQNWVNSAKNFFFFFQWSFTPLLNHMTGTLHVNFSIYSLTFELDSTHIVWRTCYVQMCTKKKLYFLFISFNTNRFAFICTLKRVCVLWVSPERIRF